MSVRCCLVVKQRNDAKASSFVIVGFDQSEFMRFKVVCYERIEV